MEIKKRVGAQPSGWRGSRPDGYTKKYMKKELNCGDNPRDIKVKIVAPEPSFGDENYQTQLMDHNLHGQIIVYKTNLESGREVTLQ